MFEHQDPLSELNDSIPLQEKLAVIHRALRAHYAFIDRIAVAVHEPHTDLLKTFMHSSGPDHPLEHYHARLTEADSLVEILRHGRPRVINDLAVFAAGPRKHTQRIGAQGYASSYTVPMYVNGEFFGFIFVNSYERDCFSDPVLAGIDPLLRLLSMMVVNELGALQTLSAVLKTTRDLFRHRDPETGAHLERMARYAQLIALELAPKYGLDDQFIEYLFLYAPMHDVGKIAIPDHILLKPGKLSDEEFAVIKTHTTKGREIIETLLHNFGLGKSRHAGMLRNIAEAHHETLDGEGYPHGLQGDQVPMEARIVAVADVFDALTSKRPYKEAWDNERAFATLRDMTPDKLDLECVEALVGNASIVELIQSRFREEELG